MGQLEKREYKIRVLHLVHSLRAGGAEIALVHYIKALGMYNYEHHVYCFKNDGPVRKKIEDIGIIVHLGPKRASINKPIRFGKSLIFLINDLLTFIRRNRIQIIQSHSGEANQLGVVIGKLSKVPAFPTIHSTKPFIDRRSRFDPRVYVVKVVNSFIYRIADKVLAVSYEIKELIHQTYGLKYSKVIVLKNGIVFDECFTKSFDVPTDFLGSENKLKLIAVGRLVPLKGFDILIKAANEAMNQGLNDFLILIAGEGVERPRLEALIQKLKVDDYVKLLGFRNDVAMLLKSSDIFVMPSSYEGLSIAMIEAMACGLPVVASNAPGLKEYINERNGLLFPIGDHIALAQRINLLANDSKMRNRLARGAISAFANEYDMRNNIKTLHTLFQKHAFLD